MDRPDGQQAAAHALSDSLGAATQQLRAALEREATEVIKRARAEAASIEEAAHRRAAEIEQEAQERALTVQQGRTRELLEAIDATEDKLRMALDGLRAQLREALGEVEEPAPEPSTEEVAPVAHERRAAVVRVEAAGSAAGSTSTLSTAEAEAAPEPSPALDELMRAQIVSMRDGGRTREEAERFLSRFKSGASYSGLLDELYPPSEDVPVPGGNGAKRRRFARRRN